MPPHEIYAGSRNVESFIGRLEPTAGPLMPHSLECPVQLKRIENDQIQATSASGQRRLGKPADVKPGLHWLLVPREKGGYHLQPVNGWYDFARPPVVELAAPAINCARPLVITSGEAELRREAKQRQENTDRWAAMLERRAARNGVKVKSGKAMDQLVPDEGDTMPQEKKDEVFLPDDERLNDEMGLRKQKKKKAKALKKEAGAVENAEDLEDVPETANALLELKREKGEAGWDVDEDELFSDDEPEPCEFDGNLDNADPQEVEAGLEADEDDADDEKDLLTSHGKQLEVLIENIDEQFESHLLPEDNDSGSDDGEQDPGPDDGERNDRPGPADDRPAKKQKLEASTMPAATLATQSSSSSSPAAPLASSSGQTNASIPETAQRQATPAEDRLKQTAIDFLKQNGGKCALKDLSRVLGLHKLKKSGQTEEYQRVVEMMREVATIVDGKNLILNEQYQERNHQKQDVAPPSSFPSASPSPPLASPSPPSASGLSSKTLAKEKVSASPSPPSASGLSSKTTAKQKVSASGLSSKATAKEKVLAPGERKDRFENLVSNFVSALHRKGFKSRLQAAEYLEGKTQGAKGLTESEVSEILRRFCRESKLKQ